MPDTLPTDEVEGRLVSERCRDAVRAVLLTSTRAIAGAEVDAFSNYDAVLVVRCRLLRCRPGGIASANGCRRTTPPAPSGARG